MRATDSSGGMEGGVIRAADSSASAEGTVIRVAGLSASVDLVGLGCTASLTPTSDVLQVRPFEDGCSCQRSCTVSYF